MGAMKKLAYSGLQSAKGMPSGGMKEFFFDRDVVVQAMDRARRKALIRGAIVIRRSAIKSIREQDASRPSRPGEPPRSVMGLLMDNIFYGYDPDTQEVLIGPEIKPARRAPGGVPVPELLEHGGLAQRGTGKPYRLAARPYMRPALERHKDRLAEQWRSTIG